MLVFATEKRKVQFSSSRGNGDGIYDNTEKLLAANRMSFPIGAPSANPVFYRSYSRLLPSGERESWDDVCDRTIAGLADLGSFTGDEADLILQNQRSFKALPSGRWLWVGGSANSRVPRNYYSAYNCESRHIDSIAAIADQFNLAMQGCGTGTVLERDVIAPLGVVRNFIEVEIIGEIGANYSPNVDLEGSAFGFIPQLERCLITVGDSRSGWVEAYKRFLEFFFGESRISKVSVDLSYVRPAGIPLRGFGGVSNPVKLTALWGKVAKVLNGAYGRIPTPGEVCLILDLAAEVVVAGSIRRSANIRQFDDDAPLLKKDLYRQGSDGKWAIDPDRAPLRMSNHTRVYHRKPTLEECVEAVREQYHSGEGAIQWAGEAVARANADLLPTNDLKRDFLRLYNESRQQAQSYLAELSEQKGFPADKRLLNHRMTRYGLNPCGEVIMRDNFCNLTEVHLNLIDPTDILSQVAAFKAAALSACALLHHKFEDEIYAYSRQVDPIVGVSFTGLFDFFVNLFGVDWLEWWQAGRPLVWGGVFGGGTYYRETEEWYLSQWRDVVARTVQKYCEQHKLPIPNRCTTVQPAGTKSLLTNASPGWHPPKAAWYIRRITFRRGDPVALACQEYGYRIIPGVGDVDLDGNLLDDHLDPRCSEWLVEIPTKTHWADLPEVENIDIPRFSAVAQFDFYMQVQRCYATHNASATIEIRESEISEVGALIHGAIAKDSGYISATLLARFDDSQVFPRLPFEPISKAEYERLESEVLASRKDGNFLSILNRFGAAPQFEAGAAPCDSDRCLR